MTRRSRGLPPRNPGHPRASTTPGALQGGDQELILALRTRSDEVWGALGVYRETGRPLFDHDEKRFLRAVAPRLADGVRRALLVGEAADPEGPDAPGLVVVDATGDIASRTPRLRRSVGREVSL